MTRKELLNSPEYWQNIAENQCYRENIDYTLQLVDKKQMMDKIVKWLDKNAFKYVETYGSNYEGFDMQGLLKDIKKGMEEE